jgi:hypothetical protein
LRLDASRIREAEHQKRPGVGYNGYRDREGGAGLKRTLAKPDCPGCFGFIVLGFIVRIVTAPFMVD